MSRVGCIRARSHSVASARHRRVALAKSLAPNLITRPVRASGIARERSRVARRREAAVRLREVVVIGENQADLILRADLRAALLWNHKKKGRRARANGARKV